VHRLPSLVVLLAFGLNGAQILHSQAASPSDPWFRRSPNAKEFETPKVPLGKFAIELPKNWQILPGYGEIIFTAAEKTRSNQPAGAIALERRQLQGTLSPADITDRIAQLELSESRERQIGGENFAHAVKEIGGTKFIMIQYSKPGIAGPEHVVQYSFAAGPAMYRLICIAPVAQLSKYQPAFAHVAASFQIS
jgi:hypothetical protein